MLKKRFDIPLLITLFVLMTFGLIMISSVSVYDSYRVTLAISNASPNPTDGPRNDFYLWRHIMALALALPTMIAIAFVPYTIWKKYAVWIFLASIVLLLLLFTPMGITLNGARGWLKVPFFPTIQPLEIIKVGVFIFFAQWLAKKDHSLHNISDGFIPYAILVTLVVGLLAAQPDFGGILVIAPVCIVLFFIAGGRIKHMAVAGILCAIFAAFVVGTVPYVNSRFKAFVDPAVDPQNRNIGWQVQQSLIAVGSGGVSGVGLGKSIQKFGYLPEVQGDIIFAAIGEETGFLGTVMLIAMYIVLAFRGFHIAQHAPDRFSMLLASGITTWFVWQAFVNMAVTIKLLPLTGITLPFISYGGTSLVMLCVGAGILLNISSHAHHTNKANFTNRRRNWGSHNA